MSLHAAGDQPTGAWVRCDMLEDFKHGRATNANSAPEPSEPPGAPRSPPDLKSLKATEPREPTEPAETRAQSQGIILHCIILYYDTTLYYIIEPLAAHCRGPDRP